MKLTLIVSTIAILLALLSSFGSAQERPWTVINLAGDTLTSCVLDSLADSMLHLTCGSFASSIHVDSITILIRHGESESHFWTGAGIGLLAGFTLGYFVSYATYEEPQRGEIRLFDREDTAAFLGVFGAFWGFLVGGMVGAQPGTTEVYDLWKRSPENKIATIRYLIGD